MKYQIGDKIILLHSNEEGEIIDFINDKMVMINVQGVKFPAYIDQIDFPYFKRFTEKKMFEPKKEKKFIDDLKKEKGKPAEKVIDGVKLTFLPVMDTDEFGDEYVELFKVHLINQTDKAYKFSYSLNYFGKSDFDLKSPVQPFEDFYLHDIPFENFNDSPSFEFDFSLVQPDKKKADHFESIIKLKPKQVFSRVEELRKKNEAFFSYKLFDSYPDKAPDDTFDMGALASKYKVYDAKKVRENLEPARSVVDLHIEKIIDDWSRMSNYEIVSLQLKTFEKYYELAVAHIQPSLVVIHGVGTGRLRDEIHELLKLRREVKTFVNQYDSRFGYGATEIFFQY
jgi:hypothetical protein